MNNQYSPKSKQQAVTSTALRFEEIIQLHILMGHVRMKKITSRVLHSLAWCKRLLTGQTMLETKKNNYATSDITAGQESERKLL